MKRLTGHDENGHVFSCEEERLLSPSGVISKDDMYKIMMHLAEKLAKYEDLEEQGKLLKLPCAVGDTVYVLRLDNAAYMMNNEKVWEIVEDRFEIRYFDCIGKTVFLTRKEAEQALKDLEGESV